jgi:hypothetical protein
VQIETRLEEKAVADEVKGRWCSGVSISRPEFCCDHSHRPLFEESSKFEEPSLHVAEDLCFLLLIAVDRHI